ncbi:hypothetical protein [Klebsiella pneumoniae]|uniref:hypothetical protein n=1 Tax=Klebsiella pneumoniae TaxID=573 RepID=UPI0040692DA6
MSDGRENSFRAPAQDKRRKPARVFVSVGTLKAARSEIQAHIKVNGKGIMTDIVLDQLNKAIGDGE